LPFIAHYNLAVTGSPKYPPLNYHSKVTSNAYHYYRAIQTASFFRSHARHWYFWRHHPTHYLLHTINGCSLVNW